jgi:hypothetical protein
MSRPVNHVQRGKTTVAGGRRAVFGAVVFGVVFLVAAAWFGWSVFDGRAPGKSRKTLGSSSSPGPAAAEMSLAGPVRALDGRPGGEGEAESPYFAVIIDNLVEARPAHGLNAAGVVYEAPVESGITRFLAIFPNGTPESQVGPVRSVRPYFIDWAAEYGALLAHVGGSPEALGRLKRGADAVTDLNEFWNGQYFWRATGRSAPHNVYASGDLLRQAAERKESETTSLRPWRFKSVRPLEERPGSGGLTIGAKTPAYAVAWDYDRERNAYRRRQGGELQVDAATGEPVLASNIVVELTQVTVLDEVGRRRIMTVGEGEAVFALDGDVYRGTWRKPSAEGRTRFFDASGNELRLNVGLTWIEVVPEGTAVTPQD